MTWGMGSKAQKSIACWLFAWLVASASCAGAAESVLAMTDTGGHTARITGVAFTADARYLVSVADDKVLRIWDLQTGTMARTIRGQSSIGQGGKLYALALSPDGQWLAVGGWTDDDEIRLYNFTTGVLVALLKDHKNLLLSLAFSPDSRLLISGSTDKTAIIWNVAEARKLHKLEGHEGFVSGAVFTANGERAVTGSFDRKLRVWRVSDGQKLSERAEHKDAIRTLAISRVTGMIATGGRSGEIRLWDENAASSRLLDQKQYVGSLAFSPDGQQLLSTCGELAWFECRNFPPRLWDVASARQILAYGREGESVVASAISPDGRWAATAGGFNNEIHVWNLATGERRWILAGRGASISAVGFSAEGGQIGFGNTRQIVKYNNRGPIEYSMQLPIDGRRLGQPERLGPGRAASFERIRDQRDALSVAHTAGAAVERKDGVLEIRRGNQVLTRIERTDVDGYRHSTYGFIDANTVLSGGSHGNLIAYRATGEKIGQKVREFAGHEGDVWALAVSADGRFVLSGADDQTLRLWNAVTGELVVSVLVTRDNEWVVWTPQGYYAASAAGGALIGWQLNRGANQAAEYVTSEQVRKTLHRPDIVERAIQLASADAAIKQINPNGLNLTDLFRLPQVSIASPRPGATNAAGGYMILVLRIVPGELPLKSISIYVNGRKDGQPTGVPPRLAKPDPGSELRAYRVRLAAGDNAIAVVAENEVGSTPIDANKLNVWHSGTGELDVLGQLIILAIGVDKYPGLPPICGRRKNEKCDLRFAGADAKHFANTLATQSRSLYGGEPIKHVLTNDAGPDEQPTKSKIETALRAVETAGPLDTVAVFFAGHGESSGDKYFLLPTDVQRDRTAGPGTGANMLDWQIVQTAVTKSRARRLLFIDACHAGSAFGSRGYNDKLGSAARTEKFVAFVAAGANQFAEEDPEKGHGVFTYALAEGLKGDALDRFARTVHVYGLNNYVYSQVSNMTNGRQEPRTDSGYANFVLVRP
jgi:WD40 repeat protein